MTDTQPALHADIEWATGKNAETLLAELAKAGLTIVRPAPPGETGIETYPVGLLRDLKHRRLEAGWRYLWKQVKAGNRRAVRNYFNGYLAEWHYRPEGVSHRRCGRGWTRRAARRRLGAHIVAMNLHPREASR